MNKQPIKISRSGRQIKVPLKISPDETSPVKKHKPSSSIHQELQLLKNQVKSLDNRRSSSSQSSSESTPNSQITTPMDPLNIPIRTTFSKLNSESTGQSRSKNIPCSSSSHEQTEMFDFVDLELFQKSSEKISDEFFKKKVLDTLDLLREQNKAILMQQELIMKQLSKSNIPTEKKLSESLLTPLRGFPIETVEGFEQFESENGKENRTNVYHHLINVGGATLRNFLSNSLKRLLTDNLVCSFTWNGGDNTIKFGDTKIANVLYQASRKCENFDGPSNKEIFKHHMLEVLRHTKQRHRKLVRKNILPMTVSEAHEEMIKLQVTKLEVEHDDEEERNESPDCEEETYDIEDKDYMIY